MIWTACVTQVCSLNIFQTYWSWSGSSSVPRPCFCASALWFQQDSHENYKNVSSFASPFSSEIDILKNENFAVSTVYGVAPQPSLKQVPLTVSEDNGRYLDIKSSEGDNKHGNTEKTNLSLSAEVDSRTSKDGLLSSVPRKELEKLSSCAPSTKAAVHFDKPNRLVRSFQLECFSETFLWSG